MEAILIAGGAAFGCLLAAVAQRRRFQLIERRLPPPAKVAAPAGFRIDSAHRKTERQTASVAAIRQTARVGVASGATTTGRTLPSPADAPWAYRDDFAEAQSSREAGATSQHVPVRISDHVLACRGWCLLTAVMVLELLLLPLWAERVAQFNVMIVPLVTLVAAAFCPIPWGWAATAVGLLHAAHYAGYALGGGVFVAGDQSFCVSIYLANTLAVAIIARLGSRR